MPAPAVARALALQPALPLGAHGAAVGSRLPRRLQRPSLRRTPPPPTRGRRAPDTTRTLEQLVERNALAPLKCFPGADGRAVQLAQLEALVSTCLSLTIARPSQKNGGRGVSKLHILSEAVEAFHAAGPARTVPPVRGNMAEKVLSRIFDEIKRMPQHRALVSG